MDCPVDGTKLHMSERQGIEIDYCPECRGVWLDRGELDKLVERADSQMPQYEHEEKRHDERRERGSYDDYEHGKKKKKRGSFLGDVFEGFGD